VSNSRLLEAHPRDLSRPPDRRPRGRSLAVLALLSATATGCRDRGAPPAADAPPARIVSLTPSATELVAAAGGLGRLVGVDRYSAWPPEVASLPRVGDFLRPSFEAILRLEPDLVVLAAVQTEVAEGLRGAGVRTLALDVHTVADVRDGLRQVGDAIGEPARAAAAIDALDETVAAVRRRAAARQGSARPRVLVVIDRELGGLGNMVAAGAGSYLDELLAVLGADNVLAGAGVRYPKISVEAILRAEPDVILDASFTPDPDAARRDWRPLDTVPAVASGRVHLLNDTMYLAPSPRLGEALRGLEEMIFAP
jgi:iron complex transport system substrate-binding protein